MAGNRQQGARFSEKYVKNGVKIQAEAAPCSTRTLRSTMSQGRHCKDARPMSNPPLQELFIALRRQLERAVSRIVPPREIEDIVQETYVRICQIDPAAAIHKPRSF